MATDVRTRPSPPARRPRPLRTAVIAALAVATAFLLSGCLTLKMDLQVQSDDTVDGAMTLAFDKTLLTTFGQDPSAFASELATQGPFDDESGAPSGGGSMTATPYDQDGKIGTTWTFTDMPLSELGGSEDSGDSLTIVREGDNFRLSGTMDLSSEEMSGSDSPIDPSQFASTFDVEIKVTFPGEIISTNGTVDGTTVSWAPKMGETVTMEALAKAEPAEGGILPLSPTSSSGGSSLLWPLLIGLLVAVVVAGVVAFLVVRGRRPAHAGAGAVPEGAAGYAPPQPYGQPQYPAQPQQYAPPPQQPYGQPQYPPQQQPYGQPQYPAQPEQPTQVLPPPAGPPAPPAAPPAAPPPAPPATPPPAPPAQGPPPPAGPPAGPPPPSGPPVG